MARKQNVPAPIPVEEQPYPIPDNWRWVRLESVCNGFQYGYTAKAIQNGSEPHFIRITDIGRGAIHEQSAPFCEISANDYSKYKIHKGDILIARMGSVGENGLATHDIDGVFASYLIRLIPRVNALFIRDYLQSLLYWNQIADNSQGTTRLNVNANQLRMLKFPLPPVPEQQRIVERIEGLFAKLDAARENAQSVLDGFETRKAAILRRAFSGELTANWRAEHGISQETWENTTLASVVGGFRYGTSEKSAYSYSGMPVLRIPNISDNGIDFSDVKFLNSSETERANQVNENDILIIRSNGSRDLVGKCALVPALTRPFAYASFLIKITPSERINPRFLLLYLNSANARAQMFFKAKSSAGIHNINSKELGAISVRLPQRQEQAKIVEIAENILAKEEQSVHAAQQVLDNIDAMKEVILARAFRGLLGTNDPAEPCAVR
ncbi:MAG: restriction endonuclease subunit S [Oscillibacter sp.]|nr:restriction endonuclease subunit S [Oscillibacter sp.]